MKNVIIFGITGFVGAYTALYLKEKGCNIFGIGKRKTDNGFFRDYDIPYYSIDIAKHENFSILPVDIEAANVLHFAGAMPSNMEGYDPKLYFDSIIIGTYNVLEYCRKIKAKKIVFTHTRADSNYLTGSKTPIQPDIQRKFPLRGDHAIYTICKNTTVDIIEHYYHEYNLRRFILRLPTIYGYHPNKYYYVNGERKIIAYRYLIDRAISSEEIEIWGDPKREKEIFYIKDFTELILACINSDISGGIYNAGNGVGVSLFDQITGIIKIFSPQTKPSKIIYKPEMPDSRQFIHDISKTKKELRFYPKYNYLESLIDFKMEMGTNRFEKLYSKGCVNSSV